MTVTRDDNVKNYDKYINLIKNSTDADLYVNFKGELKSVSREGVLGGIKRIFVKIIYGFNDDIIAKKIGKIFEQNQTKLKTEKEYSSIESALLVKVHELSPKTGQELSGHISMINNLRESNLISHNFISDKKETEHLKNIDNEDNHKILIKHEPEILL